jgi:hypothetical protein
MMCWCVWAIGSSFCLIDRVTDSRKEQEAELSSNVAKHASVALLSYYYCIIRSTYDYLTQLYMHARMP